MHFVRAINLSLNKGETVITIRFSMSQNEVPVC
jgi:hypothetical protein